MVKGTVKFYKENKGYGFITDDTETDVFFHRSGVKNGLTLEKGDEVSFDIEKGKRGAIAVNIEVC